MLSATGIGRIPVLAGTGSASTQRAVEQTRLAAELGADGALVVTPYYNQPAQPGLEAHFTAIADASEVAVILYNVPSRTAVDMLPETVERLSAHARIVGIKEAVPDVARIDELLDLCGPDFAVLSGDDNSCLEAMRHGAHGVYRSLRTWCPARCTDCAWRQRRQDWAVLMNGLISD